MTFPINTAIPNVNNDPADDVTPMNTNFVNINDYLQVDHVAPGSQGLPGNGGAGTHEQVTFNNKNNQGAQIDPTSVSYTTDGSVLSGFTPAAASTVANLVFRNQRGIFPQSALKAFGVFTWPGAVGAFNMNNAFNVASATANVGLSSTAVITLTSNATVNGVNNVALIVTAHTPLALTPKISITNNVITIDIQQGAFPIGNVYSFFAYQF